jgi:hypothetical protein
LQERHRSRNRRQFWSQTIDHVIALIVAFLERLQAGKTLPLLVACLAACL